VAVAAGIDAAEGERRCEALARRAQFLRASGLAEWPDGTVAARYAFIHALYQQVVYAGIAVGHRVGLHLRTGERLERAYGERAPEIAGELAMHFEQGRDAERAVRYRTQAGQHALRQHAYREAADHASRALHLLAALPDSPARIQQELALQVVAGSALSATLGYAAPEIARTYARARELCMQVGDTARLFPVLLGLGRFYLVRAEFQTAREVGRDLLTMAEATQDTALLLAAHNALGVVSFYAGDFEAALAHLERGIELYDPARHSPHRSPAFQLGQDPGVSCTTHAAMTLWMLGYPARAAARMREALALARAVGHPFSLSYACHFAAGFHQWRGEREVVRELEDTALAVDTEHGFELFLAAGAIQRGWLLAEDGEMARGLVQMREALERLRLVGAEVLVPAYLGLVAEVCGALGRTAEALSAVALASRAVRRSGPHYWEADLHRLHGVLMFQSETHPERDTGEARPDGDDGPACDASAPGIAAEGPEACLLDAIAIARRQRAKSLELRAAIDLGRLWARQGKSREAHAALSQVYAWFTEGFDTADLRAARSLLDQLESGAARP
jgi:predicted ATPase